MALPFVPVAWLTQTIDLVRGARDIATANFEWLITAELPDSLLKLP